ncbi:MAG: hypothetical protein OEW02_03220 [Myxococcales bacterium]|nr:hypothetical protein [Myxococcales bacterium]MDH5567781.1 hypothetical protein [Myxococcales bacterium]
MRLGIARAVWLGMLPLALAGCIVFTDPLGHQDALTQAQKRYTEAIRWGYLDRARGYIDPERQREFEQLAPLFEAIRITDYEIGELELDEGTAAVTVTYRGYAHAQQVEKSFREHQEWTRAGGLSGEWRVQSDLSESVISLLGPTL